MRRIILVCGLFALVSCQNTDNKSKKSNTATEEVQKDNNLTYASFGDSITSEASWTSTEMLNKYKTLQEGDTLQAKFTAQIADVCQRKGCWVQLNLPDGQNTMVKFKDYSFFVPTDSKGKTAVVKGKAFLKTISVKQLKHLASDAGKSAEEIAAITQPKQSLHFVADGVLIEK